MAPSGRARVGFSELGDPCEEIIKKGGGRSGHRDDGGDRARREVRGRQRPLKVPDRPHGAAHHGDGFPGVEAGSAAHRNDHVRVVVAEQGGAVGDVQVGRVGGHLSQNRSGVNECERRRQQGWRRLASPKRAGANPALVRLSIAPVIMAVAARPLSVTSSGRLAPLALTMLGSSSKRPMHFKLYILWLVTSDCKVRYHKRAPGPKCTGTGNSQSDVELV